MVGQATARLERGAALSTRTHQSALPTPVASPTRPDGPTRPPGDVDGGPDEAPGRYGHVRVVRPAQRGDSAHSSGSDPAAPGPHPLEESPAPGPSGPGGSGAGGSRHWPALDGLRAIAVLAVLLYHAGVTWLPGGLLGVDLFFVLSGFLITGLLLGEWNRSGRIDLARFWGRRARRLLPALLILLLAVCAYARFIASPGQAASLRDDSLATLFYVGNWRFALSHQGYFDTTAPSPLRHTWSLAVEEQFYLVWPLVVLAVLGLAARRTPKKRRAPRPAARRLRTVALLGALGSAATAAVMSARGVNDSRIYYGTDTRSQALFVGAALAATLTLRGEPANRAKRAALAVAGAAALAAVLVVFATVDGQSTGLYQGGFLALAIAVMITLASVVLLPDSPLARVLSVPPLRYVGRISYGLYLYHWPLFLTMTAARTHLTGPTLLGARLGATFVVAAASARFIEQPIRAGTFRIPRPRVFAPAVVAAVAVAVMGTTTLIHAPARAGGTAATLDKAAAATQKIAGGVPAKSTAANRLTRVLLLGDSVAWTFGWNIGTNHINTAKYGVEFFNQAIIGCGIMGDIPQHVEGKEDFGNQICPHWQDLWTKDVKIYNPDVVAILVGRWETTDRRINGRWTNVGQPDYDAFLAGQLDSAIADASSTGAKVALLTAPIYGTRQSAEGAVYTETLPQRVIAFNQQLRAAAARHPGLVSIVDFGDVLTPGNVFRKDINGVPVRWDDGVHVLPAGTEAEVPVIMPQLARLRPTADTAQAGRGSGATSPSPSPTPSTR